MKDLAAALAMLKNYEGCYPYMYLDSLGYVTVGVGFLLETEDSAVDYAFLLNQGNQNAAPSQIKAEWNRIKSQVPNHLGTYYRQFTTMQMAQPAIDQVLTVKLNAFEALARKTFAEWDDFPSAAQLALIDMIYNLGSLTNFPRLVRYAKKRDWTNCAAQCFRKGPGDQRNNETRDRFLAAAKEQSLTPAPAPK
jgi:GH24 family phage-related lysozyme (muramidase)